MNSSNQSNGIDTSRLLAETVDPNFICLICQNILWKPVACNACLNHFCKSCISNWLPKKNTCPICRATYQESRPAPIMISLVSKLQFTCKNKQNGCEVKISYDTLEKHEKECSYENAKCLGCHWSVLRKDKTNHEAACGEICYLCTECNGIVKKKDEISHKNERCFNEKMKSFEMKYSKLEKEHREVCAEKVSLMEKVKKLESKCSHLEQENESLWYQIEENTIFNKTHERISLVPKNNGPWEQSMPSLKNWKNKPQQTDHKQEQKNQPKPQLIGAGTSSITVADLKNKWSEFIKLDKEKQRNILGELLFPLIKDKVEDNLAPKITGMLIDLDVLEISQIFEFLEDLDLLHERIEEAKQIILSETQ